MKNTQFQFCSNITRVANEQHCHDDIIDRSAITYNRSVNYIIMALLFACNPVHFSSFYFYGNRRDIFRTLGKAVFFVQSSFLPERDQHFGRFSSKGLLQTPISAPVSTLEKCFWSLKPCVPSFDHQNAHPHHHHHHHHHPHR